jgi:hypothetical protein
MAAADLETVLTGWSSRVAIDDSLIDDLATTSAWGNSSSVVAAADRLLAQLPHAVDQDFPVNNVHGIHTFQTLKEAVLRRGVAIFGIRILRSAWRRLVVATKSPPNSQIQVS